MKYRIVHQTTYTYSASVPICHNIVHLAPREHSRQTCRFYRLSIQPRPATIGRQTDFFGNHLTLFSLHDGHQELSLRAISQVDVHETKPTDPSESAAWETVRDLVRSDASEDCFAALPFLFESPHARWSQPIAEYAQQSFPPGRPILSAVQELTERIHTDFRYDPKATRVTTTVDEVFQLRRGVCQDFAQLEVACLRSVGLPARYVSGYLRTLPPPGKPRLVGADASHAWVGVFAGELGWVDFDPTNRTRTSSNHITLAWGRDYADVSPIRGVFMGGGTHTMTVSVDVVPLDEVS